MVSYLNKAIIGECTSKLSEDGTVYYQRDVISAQEIKNAIIGKSEDPLAHLGSQMWHWELCVLMYFANEKKIKTSYKKILKKFNKKWQRDRPPSYKTWIDSYSPFLPSRVGDINSFKLCAKSWCDLESRLPNKKTVKNAKKDFLTLLTVSAFKKKSMSFSRYKFKDPHLSLLELLDNSNDLKQDFYLRVLASSVLWCLYGSESSDNERKKNTTIPSLLAQKVYKKLNLKKYRECQELKIVLKKIKECSLSKTDFTPPWQSKETDEDRIVRKNFKIDAWIRLIKKARG